MSDLIYCTDGELCENRCTDTRLCEGINPVELRKIGKLQAVVDRLAYEPQASMRHYQVIAQQYATKENDNGK